MINHTIDYEQEIKIHIDEIQLNKENGNSLQKRSRQNFC
jgi:hypothetical protein